MAGKTTSGIKHLREGGFVVLDGVPCKVDKVSISSSGKHGHAKVRLDAIGLLDGVRKSIIKTAHDNVDVPIILRKQGQVISILPDGKAQIMDMETFEYLDMEIPEDRKDEVVAGAEVEYFEVMDVKTLKKIK